MRSGICDHPWPFFAHPHHLEGRADEAAQGRETESHPERPPKGAAGTAAPCPRGLSYLFVVATTSLGAARK
jgi:hypothetical protein